MRNSWVMPICIFSLAMMGAAQAQQVSPATAFPTPKQERPGAERADRPEAAPPVDGNTIAASSNDADRLVALLIARPEIKSMLDLTGKSIAIDDGPSRSNANVRTAIMAAGAAEVQLSEGRAKALDRLIDGEVPAAVLTLAYPETADWSPEIAGFKVFRIPLASRSLQAALQPAGNATADPETARAADPAADAKTRTLLDQVAAATAVAKQMTAAASKVANSGSAAQQEAEPGNAASKSATPSTNKMATPLVALLMTQPDIKSVSDLTGKVVAIDDGQSSLNADVRTAIVTAGAPQVQLSESEGKAVDRLTRAEVPAAVLAAVSQEAAEAFPDVKGFKVFRIPLSPRSSGAQTDAPANAAAVAANRKLKEQVKVATVIAEHVMSLREGAKALSPSSGEPLVAVVLAPPEIGSVSDLAGKIIAIDDRHSDFHPKVQAAIAAAGATGTQVSAGPTNAMDRLIGGEVSAAVLTLIYPETGFSQIAGFKVFRIPL